MEYRITLPRPHKGQQQVLNSNARFKILLCGRRWGKSLISKCISIDGLLKGESIAYVTPTFSLAKDFFDEVVSFVTLPKEFVKTNKSDLTIEVGKGKIIFLSGEALDNFRGRKFHKVIIDEAAFIPDLENAWNTAIRPTLTDYKGEALFISTPNGKNFFYSLYIKGLDKVNNPAYESFHFTTYNNPFIDKTEIDEAAATLPSAKFKQEYLAEPLESEANAFGVENVLKNIIEVTNNINASMCIGIDLASHVDYTVITGIDSTGKMVYFDRFKNTWEFTKDKIRQLPFNIKKVVDATGVGDAVYSDLVSTGVGNLQPFKISSSTKPPLIQKLIKAVEKGDVKYNQVTADEMLVFQYKYSSQGYISYSAQGGFHDDTVLSIALAYEGLSAAKASANWQPYFA